MMPPKKIAGTGKSNCRIGNKQGRRKAGGMRVEVEGQVAFLLVTLKSYWTGQKRREEPK